jgi:hypothetical protein
MLSTVHERIRISAQLGIALVFLSMSTSARAQMAVTVFAGGGDDLIFDKSFTHFGAAGEYRPDWCIGGVLRLSAVFTPEQSRYQEWYQTEEEPVQRTWLARTENERMGLWSMALDLRLPFSDTLCSDGLYKGWYVFAGLGYARRMHLVDRWQQDHAGVVTTTRIEERYGTALLRAGFGGEWNFRWGCPFIEGFITAGSAYRTQGISFPNTIGVSVGYRFTTAVLEKEALEN